MERKIKLTMHLKDNTLEIFKVRIAYKTIIMLEKIR
jgi:hypothetical protein